MGSQELIYGPIALRSKNEKKGTTGGEVALRITTDNVKQGSWDKALYRGGMDSS